MRPDILFPLFADVTVLKGVGSRVKEALGRAMGTRVKDLVLTPPSGVIDRSYRPSISGAKKDEICTFTITVGRHLVPSNRKRPYRIRVYDDTGEMTLVFFQARADYLQRILPVGATRIISGKTEVFNAEMQMTHPDYVVAPSQSDDIPTYETHYPLSAGLSQKVARKAVMQAIDMAPDCPEWLDAAMIARQEWPRFKTALTQLHKPVHPVDARSDAPPRLRLAYDELFAKQLAMALVRETTRRQSGRAYVNDGSYVQDVLASAPFTPTNAQNRAFIEIVKDMTSSFRMARLLQGDVGSGKTFVAALTAAHICESGAQVALMAPTEILARQHAETLRNFLEPAGLNVQAITGRDKLHLKTSV